MLFTPIKKMLNPCEFGELESEVLAPRVVIERRRLLRLVVIGAGARLLGARVLEVGSHAEGILESELHGDIGERGDIRTVVSSLDFRQVMTRAAREARLFVEGTQMEELGYLDRIARLINVATGIPNLSSGANAVDLRPMVVSYPLLCYQLKMEPNAQIGLHDHRDYNGILVSLDGELKVDSFDFVTPRDEAYGSECFSVRAACSQVLRGGDMSLLTRDNNNMHQVKAGTAGGRALDVFTFFSREGRSYPIRLNSNSSAVRMGEIVSAAWDS